MNTGDKPQDGQQGRDPRQDSNPVVGMSYRPVVNSGAVDEGVLDKPQDGQRGRDPRQDSNPVVGTSYRPVVNSGAVDEGMLTQLWEAIHALTQSNAAVQSSMLEVVWRLSAPAEGGIGTARTVGCSGLTHPVRQEGGLVATIGLPSAVTATPGSVGQVPRTAGDGERLVLEAIHGLTQSNVAVQSLMLEVIRQLSALAEGGIGTARTVGCPGLTHPVRQEGGLVATIGLPSAVIATPGSVGQVLRAADDGKSRVATKRLVSKTSVGGDQNKPNKRRRPWRCKNCMLCHNGRCPEPVRCFNCGKIGHKKSNCTEPVGNRCKRRR